MTALALALQLIVLGLHVVVPWRLARTASAPAAQQGTPAAAPTAPDRRQLWALLATPLLLAAALAGLFSVRERIDAALAWGFSWPPTSLPVLALVFAGFAVGCSDLVLFAGFRKLEPAGWRIAAGLALALLLAASVAGELLRLGRGPAVGLTGLFLAACGRAALAFAAGEASAGPVRHFAPLAGVALPISLLGFAAPVRASLGADLATLAAASVLLLAARFLPLSLRRPAALAGVLLAAFFLDRTSELQAALEPGSKLPDLYLPTP